MRKDVGDPPTSTSTARRLENKLRSIRLPSGTTCTATATSDHAKPIITSNPAKPIITPNPAKPMIISADHLKPFSPRSGSSDNSLDEILQNFSDLIQSETGKDPDACEPGLKPFQVPLPFLGGQPLASPVTSSATPTTSTVMAAQDESKAFVQRSLSSIF